MRSLAASSSTRGHLTPRDPHDRSSHYRYSTTEDEGVQGGNNTGNHQDKDTSESHGDRGLAQYQHDGVDADDDEGDADDEFDDDNTSNNDDMNGCARWLRGFDFSTVNPFEFSPDFDAESVFAAQRFRRVAKMLSDQGLPDDVIVQLLSKAIPGPNSAGLLPSVTQEELLSNATQECEAEADTKGNVLERTWFGLFYKAGDVVDEYRLFSMRTVMPLTVSLMYNAGNMTMGPTETLTGRLLPYRYFFSGASLLALAIDMGLHFGYVPATKRIAFTRLILSYVIAVIAIGMSSWFLYYVHLHCNEMVDPISYIDGRHPLDGPNAAIDCVRQMDVVSISGPTMCILGLCMHPVPTLIFCIIFVIATMIPRAFIDTPTEQEEHWQLILAKVIIYGALVTGAVMQSYFRNRQWQRAFEETVNVRRKQDEAAKDNDEIEGLICTLVPTAVLPRLMALGTNVANLGTITAPDVDDVAADGAGEENNTNDISHGLEFYGADRGAAPPPPSSHSFCHFPSKSDAKSAVSGIALERMFSSLEYDKSVDRARCATVLFADMKGFTQWSSSKSARDVATMLNTVVCEIDSLAYQHDGVEKIKTVGDAYWAVTGLPEEFPGHADVMLRFAFDMVRCIDELNAVHPEWEGIYWRTAVHSGPLSGAILGTRQTSYEVFGRTLMVCQKVEAAGIPGRVCCTDSTLEALSEESPLMAFMERFDSSKAAVRSLIDDKLSGGFSKAQAGGYKGLPSTRQSVLSSAASNLTTSVLHLPGVISNPELDEHTVEFVDFCAVEPSQTRVYTDVDELSSPWTPDVLSMAGSDSLATSHIRPIPAEVLPGTKRRVLVQRTKVPIFTFIPFGAAQGGRSESVSHSGSTPNGEAQSIASTTPIHSASDEERPYHRSTAIASASQHQLTNVNNVPGVVGDAGSVLQLDSKTTQRSSTKSSPNHVAFDTTTRSIVPGIAGDDHLLPVPVHVSAQGSAIGSAELRSLSSTSALSHAQSTHAQSTSTSARTHSDLNNNNNNNIHTSGTFQPHRSLLLGRRISKSSTRKESTATRGSKSTKGAHISVSVDDRRQPRNASKFRQPRGLGKKASSSSSAKQTKAERKKEMEEKQRAVKDFIRQRVAMHKATLASAQKVSPTAASLRDNTTHTTAKPGTQQQTPANQADSGGDQQDGSDSDADLDEAQRQERRITKTKYRFLIQSFKDDEVEFRYGIFAAQAVLQTMKGAGVGAILLFVCVIASFGIQDHPCVSVPGLVLNGVAILLSVGAIIITSIPIGRNPILRPLFAVSPTIFGTAESATDHDDEVNSETNNTDVYDADKVSPKYVTMCPFVLLLVAFTCSVIGTSLSSRDNCFIGIDRSLVPIFGAGTLSPLVGLLPWYQMLVLIVLFVAGPGTVFSWFSLVRFNSLAVVILGGMGLIGLVMYVLEKFLRLQFSEKEMGKLMERRLYELREGREAVLATVVPRHVIPDLFKWFAHDMAPEHAVARSFDRIVVGFIQLCEPPTTATPSAIAPSTFHLGALNESEPQIGSSPHMMDVDVVEDEAELAEPDDQSWMLRLHAEVDHLIGRHTHISKIKTVGDMVMIAGPFFDGDSRQEAHSTTMSDADLCSAVSDVRSLIEVLAVRAPGFRAGVHVGPVFGACQGSSRLSFDIFGDSVNVASRVMTGQPRGSSAVSHEVRQVLIGSPDDAVRVWAETQLGEAVVRTAKGKGEITTHEIITP